MGTRMQHLSLQGFAAGSFVSRPLQTICANVQTFEEYQVVAIARSPLHFSIFPPVGAQDLGIFIIQIDTL